MHDSTDKIKRVALYSRVSTEEQAKHGLSIETQKKSLREYANEKGYAVVGEFSDEGISARKPYTKRPSLLSLLQLVESDKVDIILFTKLDRWFRNVAAYYQVQPILEKHGVAWKATLEDYETETASGRFKVNIMLSVAQDEADRTSERIKVVFDEKRSKGEPTSGACPIGYRIQEKRLVIDEEESEIAKDIFNHFLTHRSVHATQAYLSERYGRFHSRNTIKETLQNRRYIGEAYGNPNYCEQLIPADDFELVQQILSIRSERWNGTKKNRNIYLFTGLIFCGDCGRRYKSQPIGEYIYYVCTGHEQFHNCPNKKRINEEKLEKWLLENILAQFEQYNISVKAARKYAPRDNKDDIARIKRKLKRLKELYLSDLIEKDEYESDYKSLKEELSNLEESDAEQKQTSEIDLSEVRSAMELYNTLNKQSRKRFWTQLIKKIIVNANGDYIVIPN